MAFETDLFVNSIPNLTFQQQRILKEDLDDLLLWQIPYKLPDFSLCSNKRETSTVFNSFHNFVLSLRNSEIDYSTFEPKIAFNSDKIEIIDDFKAPETIMGRCPCPAESDILRCCNLKTLDAVQQCSFGCAYCSIQNFYSKNKIKVVSDLNEKLKSLNLGPEIWHIGTGQSSDSLFLGDDFGTLSALSEYASSHPDKIIELKTKAGRTDYLKTSYPLNMFFTWSVNANSVVSKEEHLTANINSRILAAKKVQEHGNLVGFHIHPMVYFKGWKNEYSELVKNICDNIDPKKTVMVGIGTLTFTKQNLKTLRTSGRPTRVTQLPLELIAGKYSYPFETKKQLFSYVYNCFPQDWKDNVFFYLCMENKDLWLSCLNREYSSNSEFEQSMKAFYFSKIK